MYSGREESKFLFSPLIPAAANPRPFPPVAPRGVGSLFVPPSLPFTFWGQGRPLPCPLKPQGPCKPGASAPLRPERGQSWPSPCGPKCYPLAQPGPWPSRASRTWPPALAFSIPTPRFRENPSSMDVFLSCSGSRVIRLWGPCEPLCGSAPSSRRSGWPGPGHSGGC